MVKFRENFYADVRIEDRSRTVIQYQDGNLQEFKTPVEVRAFLRVYDGKMWYYASVTDVAHVQKTLDRLYDAASPNPDIEKDPIVSKLERNRDRKFVFEDHSVRNIPVEEKQALLQSYLPLLSEDSACAMPIGIYLDRNSVFTFQSSLGADITYDYQTCGLSLRCSMAEGEKKFSAAWQRGCTRFEELKDLTDEIRASMRRACLPRSPSATRPSPTLCSLTKPCVRSGSWARPWVLQFCPLPSAASTPAAAMCPMTMRVQKPERTI